MTCAGFLSGACEAPATAALKIFLSPCLFVRHALVGRAPLGGNGHRSHLAQTPHDERPEQNILESEARELRRERNDGDVHRPGLAVAKSGYGEIG